VSRPRRLTSCFWSALVRLSYAQKNHDTTSRNYSEPAVLVLAHDEVELTIDGKFAQKLICVVGIEKVVNDIECRELAANCRRDFFEAESVQDSRGFRGLPSVRGGPRVLLRETAIS
jgi:hypothetical protein